VDSNTTTAPFLRFLPTVSTEDLTQNRSGSLDSVTGVGTAIRMKSAFYISAGFVVNVRLVCLFFVLRSSTFFEFRS
jgi:hypothetical protein